MNRLLSISYLAPVYLMVFGVWLGASITSAAERVALVVGNSTYPAKSVFGDISLAEKDAELLGKTLQELGFEVTIITNASRTLMMNRLLDFKESIEEGGTALFYYAGHGIEYNKKNYLMGSNALFRDRDLLGEDAIEADTVLQMITGKTPRTAMIFLDCCREPPPKSWLTSYKRTRNANTLGLAKIEAGPGLVIGFSASEGNLANDSLGGKNGPYASALVKHMKSGEQLMRVLQLAGREVNALSRKMKQEFPGEEGLVIQEPAVYGQIYHDFFFTQRKVEPAKTKSSDAEMVARLAAMQAEIERLRREKEEAANHSPIALTRPKNDGFSTGRRFTNTLGMKFIPVPGTDVLFCEHETRVKDYAAYAAANPGVNTEWQDYEYKGHKQAPDHPVVNVSWEDAKAFCSWLSKNEGKQYRLPTDHEWSVAIGIDGREDRNASPKDKDGKVTGYPWRGTWPPPTGAGNFHGSEGAGSWDKIEAYRDQHPFTAPVRSYGVGKHGLYDLSGNVWEWCEEWYSKEQTRRVLRSGSWADSKGPALQPSFRFSDDPSSRDYFYGFRCVVSATR